MSAVNNFDSYVRLDPECYSRRYSHLFAVMGCSTSKGVDTFYVYICLFLIKMWATHLASNMHHDVDGTNCSVDKCCCRASNLLYCISDYNNETNKCIKKNDSNGNRSSDNKPHQEHTIRKY